MVTNIRCADDSDDDVDLTFSDEFGGEAKDDDDADVDRDDDADDDHADTMDKVRSGISTSGAAVTNRGWCRRRTASPRNSRAWSNRSRCSKQERCTCGTSLAVRLAGVRVSFDYFGVKRV